MKTKNFFFILAAFMLVYIPVNAQTALNKYSLDVNLVKNEYSGDVKSLLFNFSDNYFGAGLTLNRYLNQSFNVGAETSFGRYGYFDNTPGNIFKMKGNKLDFNLFGSYKFNNGTIMPVDSKFAPFVTLGLGIAGYSEIPSLKATGVVPFENPMIRTGGVDLIIPFGAGVSYNISKKLSVQYKYLFNFTTGDYRDMTRTGFKDPALLGAGPVKDRYEKIAGPDSYGKHVISLKYQLGNNVDTDNDGIADKKDLCLGTPAGVTVDRTGCPLDGDGDGVADYLDKCAGTVAGVKVDASGCPVDSDKDGIADYLDKCANTPAGVKTDASGCPIDSDKDGIADYLDKCPNEKGIAANNGCPEVKVAEPVQPGTVVDPAKPADPKKPTVITPDITLKDKIMQIEITSVNFEFGKDAINKKFYEKLDVVAAILKQYKDIQVEVGGHTDNVGSSAVNEKLSAMRAGKVKDYLVSKGVEASRMTVKGYSYNEPVADNATADGRAKNRRATFKVKK
jgi:outer membrane protein OmpA-like peptidoglycan-associated protein